LKVLRAAERVLGVGGPFRYVHQLEDANDRIAVLEFATEVDGKQVEGIDKLTFDEDGLITRSGYGWRRSSNVSASASLRSDVRGRPRAPLLRPPRPGR
jgi:hypothetical protein